MANNGINGIYVGGTVQSDSFSQANQGVYIAGTGLQTASLPIGVSSVDTYTFFNNSTVPVRVTIITLPAFAVTFLGNKASLVLSGHSFQETFDRSVIASVTVEAVILGNSTTPVDTLIADTVSQISGVLKFIEN